MRTLICVVISSIIIFIIETSLNTTNNIPLPNKIIAYPCIYVLVKLIFNIITGDVGSNGDGYCGDTFSGY